MSTYSLKRVVPRRKRYTSMIPLIYAIISMPLILGKDTVQRKRIDSLQTVILYYRDNDWISSNTIWLKILCYNAFIEIFFFPFICF